MRLYATAPSGTRMDITQLYRSVTWSGSYRACARQLKAELINPSQELTYLDRPDVPIGAIVEMDDDDGATLFYGQVLISSQPSDSSILTVTCMDTGRYLANNEGWYDFQSVTPEAVAAQLCREYGVAVGDLAQTGVKLSRKFHGAAAYKIIATLYNLAGEQTGRRYIARVDGQKLVVKAKSEDVPELVIAPGANLISQTTTVDASKLYNRVAIYSSEGKVIRTLDDAESQATFGVFRKIVTQSKNEDASKTAQATLEDNQLKQTITVTCAGDTALLTGEAVALVDAYSGAAGRFWIDSDTHTWSKGIYTAKVELNFRNLMDDTTVGSEL